LTINLLYYIIYR